MNTHEKDSAKTIHRIAPIATALSVMLLAACSVPVQVPIQSKPQQPPAFVDELKQKLPNSAQQGSVSPRFNPLDDNKLELPVAAPAIVPEVVWPARGAGDFEMASPAPAIVPEVVWPARGAGDFEMASPAPEIVPVVVWPARGAGDFETATAAPPIYWHSVGVDERELNPPVAAPASIQAREDVHDRHPSLLGAVASNPKAEEGDFDRLPRLTPIVPVPNPKAGEDLRDRHPQLFAGGPRVNLRADEGLIDRHPPSLSDPALVGPTAEDNVIAQNPRRKSTVPKASPQAANAVNARHPQMYPGGPRVNLRADDLLNGPGSGVNSAPAAGAEPKDDMSYRDPSRNER
ncbi:MAG: hypothetical protein IPO29_05005 [Anaerolineae bacterium]|nr:hypothetical protein [Anaerolineae bacterium]